MYRRWIWILCFGFGCATSSTGQSVQWTSLAPGSDTVFFDSPIDSSSATELLARRIHLHVNARRSHFGLRELSWSDELAGFATSHSIDMANGDYFSHVSPDGRDLRLRMEESEVGCRLILGDGQVVTGGENLAQKSRFKRLRSDSDGNRSFEEIRTVEAVAAEIVEGWMKSDSHRANLLRPVWGREGIGVVVTTDGKVLVTQSFC